MGSLCQALFDVLMVAMGCSHAYQSVPLVPVPASRGGRATLTISIAAAGHCRCQATAYLIMVGQQLVTAPSAPKFGLPGGATVGVAVDRRFVRGWHAGAACVMAADCGAVDGPGHSCHLRRRRWGAGVSGRRSVRDLSLGWCGLAHDSLKGVRVGRR